MTPGIFLDVVRSRTCAENGKKRQAFQTVGTFPLDRTFPTACLSWRDRFAATSRDLEEEFPMDGIIYLIGLIVIVMAILSLFGLR
jgi:hypothetical protein